MVTQKTKKLRILNYTRGKLFVKKTTFLDCKQNREKILVL